MARFSDMLPMARAGLTLVPDRVLENALRRSAIELMRRTHYWREELDPVTPQPGVFEYDLDPPAGSYAEKITAAHMGECALELVRWQDIMEMAKLTGGPRCVALTPAAQTFRVWPAPAPVDTASFRLTVVLVPSRTATSLPDEIVNEWEPGIVAGARAELLGTPGAPWENPAAAGNARLMFERTVTDARGKQHSGGHALMRVRPRRFI